MSKLKLEIGLELWYRGGDTWKSGYGKIVSKREDCSCNTIYEDDVNKIWIKEKDITDQYSINGKKPFVTTAAMRRHYGEKKWTKKKK